jgi:hypothetical protein
MSVSEARIQELSDKQDLHELVARLSRGVDRCDKGLILSCYHPDAYDDHGQIKGTPEVFADSVISHLKGKFTQHSITNELFEVRGDVAFGEIYVSQQTTGADGELLFGFGRYIDKYERRNGEWRILLRRVTVEWVPPELGINPADFIAARQDRSDPSYERD